MKLKLICKGTAFVIVITLAALWATFLWPTQWQYFTSGTYNIRVSRFNGLTEVLYPQEGWRQATPQRLWREYFDRY